MRFVKFSVVLLALLFLPLAFHAQTATKAPAAKTQASAPAPAHDLSGIWYPGLGGNGHFGQSFPQQ